MVRVCSRCQFGSENISTRSQQHTHLRCGWSDELGPQTESLCPGSHNPFEHSRGLWSRSTPPKPNAVEGRIMKPRLAAVGCVSVFKRDEVNMGSFEDTSAWATQCLGRPGKNQGRSAAARLTGLVVELRPMISGLAFLRSNQHGRLKSRFALP